MNIDENFIQRVFRSSFWWSLLVLSYLLLASLLSAAAGFTIGVAMGLGVLKAIEAAVKKIIVPGKIGLAKPKMFFFSGMKYVVLGVTIYFVARSGWISLPAFACGVGVPSAIMFLKTLAQIFREIEFHPTWGNTLEPEWVKARESK